MRFSLIVEESESYGSYDQAYGSMMSHWTYKLWPHVKYLDGKVSPLPAPAPAPVQDDLLVVRREEEGALRGLPMVRVAISGQGI